MDQTAREKRTLKFMRTSAVSRKIFRGGGVDMNIHYRYSIIFEVNFYEVIVYAILTLSGINIAMLVIVFSLSLLPLFSGESRIWQSAAKPGSWGWSPRPPTDFYGFYIKNTHLSTLLVEKGCTVYLQSVQSVIDNTKIFW